MTKKINLINSLEVKAVESLYKKARKFNVETDVDFYVEAVRRGVLSLQAANKEIDLLISLEKEKIAAEKAAKKIAEEEAIKEKLAVERAAKKEEKIRAAKAAAHERKIVGRAKHKAQLTTKRKRRRMVNMIKKIIFDHKREFFEQSKDSRLSQSFLKITIGEEDCGFEIIDSQESMHLRNNNVTEKSVTLNGFTKRYDRFNETILVLNINEIAEAGYAHYFAEPIIIDINNENVYVYDKEEGVFFDWKEREIYSVEEIKEMEGIKAFKGAFVTPSQEKKKEATFVEYIDESDFLETIDTMTNGMYSLLADGRKLDFQGLVKLGARLSQGLAPSAKMENLPIESVAVLMSEDMRIHADGGGFTKSKEGLPIGLGLQMRNFAADKWYGLSIGESTMDRHISLWTEKVSVVKVDKLIEAGLSKEEAQDLFDQAKLGNGPWAEKLIILGDSDITPDVFIDSNILKVTIDIFDSIPGCYHVLDLAGPVQTKKITFGSQMMAALLLSKEGRELIVDLLSETVADAIASDIQDKFKKLVLDNNSKVFKKIVQAYLDEPARVPNYEDLEDAKEYPLGLVEMINPKFAKTMDKGTKMSIEKTLGNKISKVLANFQPKVSGKYLNVFSDFGMDYGAEGLKENQIYAPDLPLGEVVGIRSPKGGIMEHNVYTNVPLSVVEENLRQEKLPRDVFLVIMETYSSMRRNNGAGVVPSSEMTKLLHSGMDHDFDGVTFITEKRIVEYFSNLSPIVVKVTDEGSSQSELGSNFIFDINYIKDIFEYQFGSGNLSVGQVCNHSHTWIMLLSNIAIARNALAIAFDNEASEDLSTEYSGLSYKPLTYNRRYVEVNDSITRSLLNHLKGIDFAKIDAKYIEQILFDINVLMNQYIQKTIDSSKSGEKVEIPSSLMINNFVKALSLNKDFFIMPYGKMEKGCIEHGNLVIKIDNSPTKAIKNKEGQQMIIFNDFYNQARIRVARAATRILKEITDQEAKLDLETALLRDKAVYNKSEFMTFNFIFNDINSDRLRRLRITKSDEERSSINKEYRDTVSYLSNLIRMSTVKDSPMNRVLSAIDVSTNKKGEGVKSTSSSFASSVLSWEYLLLVSSHKYGLDFIGSRIHKDKSFMVGDFVIVQNGKITHLNDNKINGIDIDIKDGAYTVYEHDRKLYAGEPIAPLLNNEIVLNKKFMVRMNSGQNFDEITKEIEDKVSISTFFSNRKGDFINNKYKIDLPVGKSNYADAIDGVIAKVDKKVLSTSKDKHKNTLAQMFLCLEVLEKKTQESTRKAGANKGTKISPSISPAINNNISVEDNEIPIDILFTPEGDVIEISPSK